MVMVRALCPTQQVTLPYEVGDLATLPLAGTTTPTSARYQRYLVFTGIYSLLRSVTMVL